MERVVRHFDSFEAADIEEDLAMTPEQRIANRSRTPGKILSRCSSARICAILSNYSTPAGLISIDGLITHP
jgi:hypothetical protein